MGRECDGHAMRCSDLFPAWWSCRPTAKLFTIAVGEEQAGCEKFCRLGPRSVGGDWYGKRVNALERAGSMDGPGGHALPEGERERRCGLRFGRSRVSEFDVWLLAAAANQAGRQQAQR
jgi:hypothetical protein